MKFTIAVFTVLIIGSNAQLLSNILNSVAATTQANGLLNSFLTNINQAVVSNNQNINQQVQGVLSTIEGILNEVLTVAQPQLSVSEIAELTLEITNTLASFTINTTSTITQASAVVNGLSGLIANTVNPYITALGSEIRNGELKLKCFTDKVPEIDSQIDAAVAYTQNGLSDVVGAVFSLVGGDIEFLQNTYDGFVNATQTGLSLVS